MENEGLRPVRGTWRVNELERDSEFPHEVGFRKALQNALDRVSEEGWPAGGPYKEVVVEYVIGEMDVVNPGHIIEYAAILKPSG
jgi:hypothetical protein